jgi:hypothetical protein
VRLLSNALAITLSPSTPNWFPTNRDPHKNAINNRSSSFIVVANTHRNPYPGGTASSKWCYWPVRQQTLAHHPVLVFLRALPVNSWTHTGYRYERTAKDACTAAQVPCFEIGHIRAQFAHYFFALIGRCPLALCVPTHQRACY